MLYNVPGRTGCNIDAATCAKLATIPHVIGVKEASGNITQMVEICRAVPKEFLVLSGDDALTLPLMAIGGRGVISVAANVIPAAMSNMVVAAERGDVAGARQMHHHIVPLMLGNFIESNPGPVKFAMAVLGLCEEVYRLPMVSPRPASQEKIRAFLKEAGVVPAPVGADD
jgi:4-hydroxy-tetrahydrodipicolinate synthase